MLALRTGWTPDVLADLPVRFRTACHWALFAQSLVPADGLPSLGPPTPGLTPEQRIARAKAAAGLARLRADLFPD